MHARMWCEAGHWWIEDLESTRGTRLDGREIGGKGPCRLEPGAEIRVGATSLMLVGPRWHRLRCNGLVVDLEIVAEISAALVHCYPDTVVPRVTVRNWSDRPRAQSRLQIVVAGCGETEAIEIPPLEPGQCLDLPSPAFRLGSDAHGSLERGLRSVSVRLDGQPLEKAEPIDCLLLAHNEWSYAEEHWLSLAAFVLCNHPLVAQATLDASAHLQETARADPATVLNALHDYFYTHWHLQYCLEPPHQDVQSQKVRLPHQVLLDLTQRYGEGTCLDLALLFAACLERLRLQPLLAVLDIGDCRHALVGCWREAGARVESLLVGDDAEQRRSLSQRLQGAIWIDPTSIAWDPANPGNRLEFARSCEVAAGYLADATHERSIATLLFGVDIAAARVYDRIGPLPFAGEPQWSESSRRALQEAQASADAVPTQLATVPLLIGLIGLEEGVVREMWPARLGNGNLARERLLRGLPMRPGATRPSDGYLQACRLALERARAEGSPLVLESHLLSGLLETPSTALDQALHLLGTDRAELLALLRDLQRGARQRETSYSLFSQFDPQLAD
jgi:hypothetical protein